MYASLFKTRYGKLTGRDWIRRLTPDDLAVFIQIGLAAMEYGRLGGRARAAQAGRDARGRFVKESSLTSVSI